MPKTAEEIAAEEKAKADSAGGNVPDKLLPVLDGITKRLDSLASRMDSMDEATCAADKARKDAADKEEAEAKKDAEEKARKDAAGEGEGEGEPEVEAMAKKDAEEKAKKDAKKDSDAKLAKEAHELEGEAMKDAQLRNDAQFSELKAQIDQLRQTNAELTARTTPISDEMLDSMADIQAHCDSVAQLHGKSAPRPLSGEAPLAYRKRLLKPFVKFSDRWKDAAETISVLPETAFARVEEQVYADAAAAARNPANVPGGELRAITRQSGGHQIIEYHGSPGSWMNPLSGATRQRVTGSFKTGSAN